MAGILPPIPPDPRRLQLRQGPVEALAGTGAHPNLPTRILPGFPCREALLDRLRELIAWDFDYCLVTYSGQEGTGILPHRDASYADYEGRGWNISGTCSFRYWEGRKSFGYAPSSREYDPQRDPPTTLITIQPGDIVRFNVKNLHAADPSPDRWNLNFWKAKRERVAS